MSGWMFFSPSVQEEWAAYLDQAVNHVTSELKNIKGMSKTLVTIRSYTTKAKGGC